MTDLAHLPEPRTPAEKWAAVLGTCLGMLNQVGMDELPTELSDLAQMLRAMRDLKDIVATVERQVEAEVARVMPSHIEVIEGVGTLERKKGSKRTIWDHTGLVTEIEKLAKEPAQRCDPMTGEVVRTELEAFRALLLASVAFQYWRKGELRGLGVAVDAYTEQVEPRTSVVIRT